MCPDHLAQFVVALAREHLDLSEIVASYKSGLGQPPFDPRMMTALLLYAYCSGLYSSLRIAKACAERVDFMMIVAHDAPDFRTIADLRKHHLPPLGRRASLVHALRQLAFLNLAASSDPPVASPALYECAPAPASLPPSTMRYSLRIGRPSKKHSRISLVPAAYQACADSDVPETCGVMP
jgi:Transposase domain (DUF772)